MIMCKIVVALILSTRCVPIGHLHETTSFIAQGSGLTYQTGVDLDVRSQFLVNATLEDFQVLGQFLDYLMIWDEYPPLHPLHPQSYGVSASFETPTSSTQLHPEIKLADRISSPNFEMFPLH
ncbi:hypothetical protein FB446DRAFT_100968 [Lentinula raphanica]|nr:hypothetical protein FB446DRAFT_100968 [Lentinula raphanica]